MTPAAPDAETIGRRLRLMEDALAHLRALRNTPVASLAREPVIRAAVERFIQVVIDLALDVNGHVVVALGHPAPETGRESFIAMARAGVLDTELAERLAPAAGLRNLLIHHYAEVRIELVAEAISQIVEDFPAYLRQVATFLVAME